MTRTRRLSCPPASAVLLAAALLAISGCASPHRSAPDAYRAPPPAPAAPSSTLLQSTASGARSLGNLTWKTITAPARLFQKHPHAPASAQNQPASKPPDVLIVAPEGDGAGVPMLIAPATNP